VRTKICYIHMHKGSEILLFNFIILNFFIYLHLKYKVCLVKSEVWKYTSNNISLWSNIPVHLCVSAILRL
jgi:hypothetical protein